MNHAECDSVVIDGGNRDVMTQAVMAMVAADFPWITIICYASAVQMNDTDAAEVSCMVPTDVIDCVMAIRA